MKKQFHISRLFSVVCIVSFLVAVGCSNSTSDQNESMEETNDTEMDDTKKERLRHVVLFSFKNDAAPEDIAKAEEAFATLPSKIPQIREFEWGLNNSPEGLDKGFTHCFFLTFDSEKDRAIYLPHPDHKAFGAVLGSVLKDVLVVDYWVRG